MTYVAQMTVTVSLRSKEVIWKPKCKSVGLASRLNSTTFNESFHLMIYVGSNIKVITCVHGHTITEVYSITNLVEV